MPPHGSFTHVHSQNWQHASLRHDCAQMNALCALRFSVSYCEKNDVRNTLKMTSVNHILVEQHEIETMARYFIPWVYMQAMSTQKPRPRIPLCLYALLLSQLSFYRPNKYQRDETRRRNRPKSVNCAIWATERSFRHRLRLFSSDCAWCLEHAIFVWKPYINFHSFIHSWRS